MAVEIESKYINLTRKHELIDKILNEEGKRLSLAHPKRTAFKQTKAFTIF
jgi:hypothetical protein